ncbi:hypothetical protein Mame01_06980 [Microbispora amethystogenes]|nr:hypothetical protein Mame01_06980 [Microbispora amethystogenes]
MIAAATGTPSPGSLSRESTHSTSARMFIPAPIFCQVRPSWHSRPCPLRSRRAERAALNLPNAIDTRAPPPAGRLVLVAITRN